MERDGPDVHLVAHASGEAVVHQAARDQHFHYGDGVRGRRRGEAAGDECPYPGLAAFGPDQARWFFGRDEVVAELIDRLDGRLERGGPQLVVAPSGAGKSSLLRAGLVPRLQAGALPGSAAWAVLTLMPGPDPLRALAAAICLRTGGQADEVAEALATDPGSGARLLRATGLPGRTVLIVDQFEEVFTLCGAQSRRAAFIEALDRLAGPGQALVVAGLRADFYPACAGYAALRRALQDRQLLVGAMSEEQVREAILYPAQEAGLEVEPGLTELLLRDLGVRDDRGRDGGIRDGGVSDGGVRYGGVRYGGAGEGYEAGRLPLLAHALRATWQQRHGSSLTAQGYRDTGTIHQAIAKSAELVHTALDPGARQAVRPLFLRLVKLGDHGEDTRRPLSRDDVAGEAAVAALTAFTDARLITQDAGTIHITHEALLREWPRLRGWLDADRAGGLLRQDLEDTAAAWTRSRHDASLLYRGSRLEAARAWAAEHGVHDDRARRNARDRTRADHPGKAGEGGGLSPAGQEFLGASVRAWRRGRRLRTGVTAVLTVLTVLAGAAAVFASVQRSEAVRQRDTALFHRILAESDRTAGTDIALSAQLALLAHRRRPPDQPPGETYTRLLTTQHVPLPAQLTGHRGDVNQVEFTPDGRTLVSAGGDGRLRLWDVARGQGRTLTGHAGPVYALAIGRAGTTVASAGSAGEVRLWDVTDPARPGPKGILATGSAEDVNHVAFSPDGRTLAAAGNAGTMWTWDATHPERPGRRLKHHDSAVHAVVFSPDGRTMASSDADGVVRLWDMSAKDGPTPRVQRRIGSGGVPVNALAFSPDGKLLVSSGTDRAIRVWDVTVPGRIEPRANPVPGHTNTVRALAFSPDGVTLASSGDDQTIRMWDLTSPFWPVPRGRPLTGHRDNVWGLAFSPDGTVLASGGDDDIIRLWHLPAGQRSAHAGGVTTTAFSPDGRVLASGGGDSKVRLWDVTDRLRPRGSASHTGYVYAVAFSPDGRTLASAAADRAVRLWDVTGRPTSRGPPLRGHAGAVHAVAFSPDGRTLASGDAAGVVRMWDVTDPNRPTLRGRPLPSRPLPGYSGFVHGLAFSHDGTTLAAATHDKSVRLWDVRDPGRPAERDRLVTGHTGSVRAVAFSPDGRTLASAGEDRQVRLWDLTGRPASRRLTGHTGAVFSVTFSPDGRTLASAGADGSLRLYDVRDPARPAVRGGPLTAHTDNVMSVAFSPDGTRLAGGGNHYLVSLWHLDEERAARRVCALTRLTPQDWRDHVGADLPYDPPCR
ncbi:hypothetical protein AB0C28_17655 [Nonomuraea sp. NPDC048892]|uniref:nSTAND1 domain-containing NTPase n=1 Tax=Nonomuraea sp. NPDC048892 TaxID=3154624 RepID=UPI0033E1CA69